MQRLWSQTSAAYSNTNGSSGSGSGSGSGSNSRGGGGDDDGGDFKVEKSDSLDDWLSGDGLMPPSDASSPDRPTSGGKAGPSAVTATAETSPHSHAVDISRDGTDFRAVFVEAPLGLTLTKGPRGIAVVTKVADGGQAERLGVSVGDTVVGVGSLWVHGFDDVMGVLPKTPYPVALVLRRGLRNMIGRTGAQVVKGSQVRCVE